MREWLTGLAVLLAAVAVNTPLMAGEARDDIHASAELAQPVLPGMVAPAFQVRDVRGNDFHFDPEAMQKPLILTFYRGGWCPWCLVYLSELRLIERDLLDMGFDLWFVSMDSPEVLADMLDEPDTDYKVLSDSRMHATRAFGIAFKVDEETYQRYLTYDIDLEAESGETHHVLPVPSTFIIGTDGIINFQYTNVDYHVRLDPDILMTAARAYLNDTDNRLRRAREAQRKNNQ